MSPLFRGPRSALRVAPSNPAPTAPSNLSASTDWTTSGAVNLTWTDNSTDETAFVIEKSTDNVTFTEHGTAAADATSYQVTGLTDDTLYYFRLKARGAGGDSDPTTAASATPRYLPTDEATIYAWWEGDSEVTETGGGVSGWGDRSANSYDLSDNGDSAKRPTKQTNVMNGHTVIRGDGTDGLVRNTAWPDSCTAFLVFSVATNTGMLGLLGSSAVADPGGIYNANSALINVQNNAGTLRLYNNVKGYVNVEAISTSTKYLLSFTLNSSTGAMKAWLNGVSKIDTTGYSAGTGYKTHMVALTGYNGPMNGDIGAIVICNSVLSDATRVKIQNRLTAYYGI